MLHLRRCWSHKEKNGCRAVMGPMVKLKIDHEPERLRVYTGNLPVRDGGPPESIHHDVLAGFERRKDRRVYCVDMRGYMEQLFCRRGDATESVPFRRMMKVVYNVP